jgi:hypothetical protein
MWTEHDLTGKYVFFREVAWWFQTLTEKNVGMLGPYTPSNPVQNPMIYHPFPDKNNYCG